MPERKGVHLVTVNDYLARRDAEWMSPIYDALGVTVGVLQNMQPIEEKHRQYACDVVYGTNSEFGFDYLRDNMATDIAEKVQRGHAYAIVDEVDNILIDEARTPLIISGAPEQAADLYVSSRGSRRGWGRERRPKGWTRARRRSSSPTSTSRSTRSRRPSRSPSRASPRQSGSSASTTCIAPRTAISSTT